MKRLFLIAVVLTLVIPGVLAYQQDFQNYDGTDMTSWGPAQLIKFTRSETQEACMTWIFGGAGSFTYYNTPQSATNWSVVLYDNLGGNPLTGGQFRFYRDAVLLDTIIDTNLTGNAPTRFDFVLNTGDMKIRTYVNGTYRQVTAALAQTPNYFYAGGYRAGFDTNYLLDDYIISPSPDADRATRNIIESLPNDYYIILDALVPANNGLYNGSGLVNSGWYYNKYSTVSNASKTLEVVKWDTGVTYVSQSVGGCANETQWSIATLAASGAPTGLYRFEWDEAGYGEHRSNPFYITRGAATVEWNSHIQYSDGIASTTWTVQPGYWDLASYTYTGEIVDVYGTVKKTWAISAASGTESTTLDATTYPAGVYYTDVKRTLIAAPNTVEMLGYDYMELFAITKLSGVTYNATVNTTLPSTFINFTQSGVTVNTTSDGTAATYNKSGFSTGNAITIEPVKDPLLFVPITFTPLSYGNFTINLYATSDVQNGSLTSNSTIFGLVQTSPYYNASGGATVTAWNATNYVTTLTNATGYYNITGCLPFSEYYMNASATGYVNTTPDTVNSSSTYKGTLYNSTRHDFLLSTMYTMNLTFKDSATGALIPVVTVTDSNGYSAITSTGLFSHTYPYSLVVFYFSATGYASSSASYVIDSDRDETVYLTSSTAASQAMWNSPHQVRWLVVDRYGNRQSNVSINATPISTTIPSGNWMLTMFGLGSTVTPLINQSSMYGTTGSDGATVFTMLGSIQYDLLFTEPTKGINHLIHVNPIEDQYTVWVVTSAMAVATNCGMTANATLFVNTTGTAWTNLNVSYMDSSLTTTNFTFWLQWPNGTTIHSTDFFGPTPNNQTVYTNWTVANTAGQMYVWGYWANTTACGNFSQAQGITLKGPTGRITSLDPCNGYALGWDATC